MSIRTIIAALALAGSGLAGGATAAAAAPLAAAAASPAVVLTSTVAPPAVLSTVAPPAVLATVAPPAAGTFGNPHQQIAVTLADVTGGGSQSQGIPIPH
jgi:hypothetical protein